jgi:putative transposase
MPRPTHPYVPTWAGFIFLAIVLDVWSRRIVGWAIGEQMTAELVLAALNMAIVQRRPDDVIHHSDQGSQYTSIEFGRRCKKLGVRPSMGSVGDAYDNAMAESFFASLECELIDRRSFPTKAEARMAVFIYIEGWYNPRRRHSALGRVSPATFERSQIHPEPATICKAVEAPAPA